MGLGFRVAGLGFGALMGCEGSSLGGLKNLRVLGLRALRDVEGLRLSFSRCWV